MRPPTSARVKVRQALRAREDCIARTRLQVKLAMLLLLLTSLPCVADERSTEVDGLFKAVDRNNGPGCAVSVYRSGKKLYEQGYGMANLEYGIPIRPSSAFQIGSATKQFTAMAVLLLAKDGKLALLDDIHKYIPELPQYEAPVTIQEMLWHTSGLRDIYDLVDLRDRDDDSPLTQGKFLKIIAQQRSLNFNPGTGFLYSNSNYLLLAILVERTSGKQLNRFMEERIFGPLGMSHTILLDKKQWLVPNRAYSYSKDESGRYQNRFQIDEIVGFNWNLHYPRRHCQVERRAYWGCSPREGDRPATGADGNYYGGQAA